jgi:hypothetical protein
MKMKMQLKTLGVPEHNEKKWEVIFHDEFIPEYRKLSVAVQDELNALATNLRNRGPLLGRPQVDTLKGSRHPNMKELRFNAEGGVWRFAFAFDPNRNAIVLVGGDKAGIAQDRFYRGLLRVADERFAQHLKSLQPEKRE